MAASWTKLANSPMAPAGAKEDDVFPTSAMRAFAVSGTASSIYKTEDGGQTWPSIFKHVGTYFRSVLFVDDNHGFASNLGPFPQTPITDPTVLYETLNGGGSWQPVTNISGPMPTGILANQTHIDDQHLVAGRVNGPAYMLSSSDAGASWVSHYFNSQLTMLIDAHFTTPLDGLVVGGSNSNPMVCTILHTADGGSTWQPVFSSQTPGSLCWKISFPSAQVGYVSVQDQMSGPATFAKTIDGGKTWIEYPLPSTDPYPAIGIGFITEDIGWVAPEDSSLDVYRTADGGKSWAVDPALKAPINRFRFVDHQTAYAIGGAVWKLEIAWPTP